VEIGDFCQHANCYADNQSVGSDSCLVFLKDGKLKVENPVFIATEELLWVGADASKVLIQAGVRIPYHTKA
jgi:hypothetical protein